jgi:hypothetical protein
MPHDFGHSWANVTPVNCCFPINSYTNVTQGRCCVLDHSCTNRSPNYSCTIMSSNNDLGSFLFWCDLRTHFCATIGSNNDICLIPFFALQWNPLLEPILVQHWALLDYTVPWQSDTILEYAPMAQSPYQIQSKSVQRFSNRIMRTDRQTWPALHEFISSTLCEERIITQTKST